MIDRHGKPLYVAWSAVELIWLEAAISLPTELERMEAYRDIHLMAGRSYEAVKRKALNMLMEKEEARLRREFGIISQARIRAMALPPSSLRQPTKKQLMGGSRY